MQVLKNTPEALFSKSNQTRDFTKFGTQSETVTKTSSNSDQQQLLSNLSNINNSY